jgi:hypothetical protein
LGHTDGDCVFVQQCNIFITAVCLMVLINESSGLWKTIV